LRKEYDYHSDPEFLTVKKRVDQSHTIEQSFFYDAIENCKTLKEFRERALEWIDMVELDVGDLRLSIENIRKE
jgi:hypothetical protein